MLKLCWNGTVFPCSGCHVNNDCMSLQLEYQPPLTNKLKHSKDTHKQHTSMKKEESQTLERILISLQMHTTSQVISHSTGIQNYN